MTDDQINELIELGKIMPDMARTASELARLADLSTDPATVNILTQIMRGYLSCASDPCEAHLEPMPLVNPDYVFRGNDEVGDVEAFKSADGIPVALWRCRSFMHRMQFLYDGMLAVVYASAPIPTLAMRLDLKEMGFVFEPTER